uniref:Uncharacterized protein n=1 Tax=Aureoumbra lagunensis TaxID=44058 RepID=A0A7S3K6A9_9STRA
MRPGEGLLRMPRIRSEFTTKFDKKTQRSTNFEKPTLPLPTPEVPELESLDEQIEDMRYKITQLQAPSVTKKDWLVVAAVAAQSRHARASDTFITESIAPEKIDLYPNYARELRRKQIESKKNNTNNNAGKPAEFWPPSPVVRINYHN